MSGRIRTVLGDVDAKRITGAVTHEHTLLYQAGELPRTKYVAAAMPALKKRLTREFRELVKRGINCFVDCNTALGIRIPDELHAIARATGMYLVLSTGYYTEASLPPRIKRASVGDLTQSGDPPWLASSADAGSLLKPSEASQERTSCRKPPRGTPRRLRLAARLERLTQIPAFRACFGG